MTLRVVIVVLGFSLLGDTVAHGETPPQATSPQATPAPTADASGGVAVEESEGLRHLLWVPRVVFYVPMRVTELLFEPVRAFSYAWERFRIPDRFTEVFFNESGNFGIFPVAFIDTGFGLNAGLRLIHRDMFGRGENVLLRASYGGRYRQFYSASVDSGRRLGRFKLKLKGGYEEGPQDPFYGIGNGDEIAREKITGLIDPLTEETAVSTNFRRDRAFAKLSLGARVLRGLNATLSTEVRWQNFERRASSADIGEFFDTTKLVGIGDGTFDVYPQLRLTFDNRTVANPYMVQAMSSSGVYLSGWLGYARGFHGDPSNHLRYAADLQWFIDLSRGDRVLILRIVLDGVTADLDKIPFVDLPEAGGGKLLRGYAYDRFRDRVVTLGSAEYQYNLSLWTTAYLFIDTGRVWRSLSDFHLERFRMGFGGGVLVHTATSFMARIQLASSIDGGFFINFGLDPVYDPRTKD